MQILGLAFSGGISFGELKVRMAEVPKLPGVYAVVLKSEVAPKFLQCGTGGHFKGIDPNVSLAELQANWVNRATLLYIGKAGGTGVKATLRSRLRQYEAFGRGIAIGHKGGRYIWQLADSMELNVWWHTCEAEPGIVESGMISDFKRSHGVRPFANLKG